MIYAIAWVFVGWTIATAGFVIYVLYLLLDTFLSESVPEQKIAVGILSLVTIVSYEFAWNQSIVATARMVFSTHKIPEFPAFRTGGIVVAVAGILFVSARERRRIRSEIREIQTQRRDTYLDRSYVSEQILVDGWSSRLEPSRLDIIPETGFLSRARSVFGGKVQGDTRVVLEFENDPDSELPRGLEEAYLRGELVWWNIRFVRVDETTAKIVVWIDSIDPNTIAEGLHDVIEAAKSAIESANRDTICKGEKTRVSITLIRPYSILLRLLYHRELSAIDKLYRDNSGKAELPGIGHPKLTVKSGWKEEIDVTSRYYRGTFKEAATTIAHAFTDTTLFPARCGDKTTDDVLEIWIESDERLKYEIPLRNSSLAECTGSIEFFDGVGGNSAEQALHRNNSLPNFSSDLTVRYVCVIESRVVTFVDFNDTKGVNNSRTYRISWEKREQDSDPELTVRDVTNLLNSEENQRAKLAVVWRDD